MCIVVVVFKCTFNYKVISHVYIYIYFYRPNILDNEQCPQNDIFRHILTIVY